MTNKFSNLIRAALAVSLMALASGCAAGSSKVTETMRVSVKGVNYSGDVMVFSVDDPAAPKNSTGGDRAGPYSGAGVQCCIELPKVWHPGIQFVIDAIIYPVDETDFKRELPRYMKKFTVDVPQYATDQPTELWVIRTPRGEMDLVASNVDPTHEAWPGSIKGWPEPSLAVKKRYWNDKVNQTRDAIDRTRASLAKGTSDPSVRQADWDWFKRYESKEIARFGGPDDPAFAEFVKKDRESTLKFFEAKLRNLMESKP